MKKFFAILLSICLSITYISFSYVLAETNNEFKLKGVLYENSSFNEINSDSQLNVTSNMLINIQEDMVTLNGTIKFSDDYYKITTSGILYRSPVDYYKDSRITGIINDTPQFEFLHFSIENNANENFLLTPNKIHKNKTILRIALKNKSTNDIIYFENSININIDINNFEMIDPSESKYEDIHLAENWYLPFMQVEKEKISNTYGIDNMIIEKQIFNNEDTFSLFPDDLPYNVPTSVFTKKGEDTHNDNFNGYYKITNEWPVGSGNLLTYFIQWNYTEKVPDGEDDNYIYVHTEILTNNQYLYTKHDGKINFYDDYCPLKIKNIKLASYFKYENDEFFFQRNFLGKTSDNSHPIKAALALCKYTSPLYYSWTELTNKETQYIGKNEKTWPTLRSQQEAQLNGKVVRAISGECTEWLHNEGDYFKMKGYSTDEGYGEKALYFNIKLDVYSRNGWGRYTIKEWSPSKSYFRKFTR